MLTMKDETWIIIIILTLLLSLVGNSLQYLMISSAEDKVEAQRLVIKELKVENAELADAVKECVAKKVKIAPPVKEKFMKRKKYGKR